MSKEEFDTLFSKALPMQHAVELWWLIDQLNDLQPSSILEVGGGATSFFWGVFAPTVSLTLDTYSDSVPAGTEECLVFAEYPHYDGNPLYSGAKTFVCDSHRQETLDSVSAFGPFDFLFIDGDHSRVGIEQDIKMYVPLVNPGGLVAFHDWDHHGTYPPDPYCAPVQEACRNLGITPEVKSIGKGYGIAAYRV
jgi:hypothetical protein